MIHAFLLNAQPSTFTYRSNTQIPSYVFLDFQESMQNYQEMGDNYEPSADELIDVLKNLENLAAINPALYRAIVDRIKSKRQSVLKHENQTHHQHIFCILFFSFKLCRIVLLLYNVNVMYDMLSCLGYSLQDLN